MVRIRNSFPELLGDVFTMLHNVVLHATTLLFFVFMLTIFLNSLNIKNNKILNNIIKISNVLFLTSIFVAVLFKFFIYIFYIRFSTVHFLNYNLTYLEYQFCNTPITFSSRNSLLSDCIILLCFSSGVVSIYLLGNKSITKNFSNVGVFCIFVVNTVIMVYTTNLLIMFLGFEGLFIPTIYFAYIYGYVKRSDKSVEILLYWTLFGTFLVFLAITYLYVKYKTLDLYILVNVNFSYFEQILLYLAFFIGFGVKIPVAPFHFWLTKIHVEAPAGFSIFLSGFLVKAALYCFVSFNLIFSTTFLTLLTSVIAIFSVFEASLKMWAQTDFKKLIAFATIQEMNLILFFLVNFTNFLEFPVVAFILMHGLLSTLMFFVVDIIQKKTLSRNLIYISGIAYSFKELNFILWFILLNFVGFPLTIKFTIEWAAISLILLESHYVFSAYLAVVVVIGSLGFGKQIIALLYGVPKHELTISIFMSKKDKYLILFLVITLTLFNLIFLSL